MTRYNLPTSKKEKIELLKGILSGEKTIDAIRQPDTVLVLEDDQDANTLILVKNGSPDHQRITVGDFEKMDKTIDTVIHLRYKGTDARMKYGEWLKYH